MKGLALMLKSLDSAKYACQYVFENVHVTGRVLGSLLLMHKATPVHKPAKSEELTQQLNHAKKEGKSIQNTIGYFANKNTNNNMSALYL